MKAEAILNETRQPTKRDPAGEKLDETIEETFPASDAPANTVETGIRVGAVKSTDTPVRDNPTAHRFEIDVDGQVAFLQYQRKPDRLVLVHTEVPPSLRGRGLANILAKAALQTARTGGLQADVRCPFVRAYLERHPEMR